MLSSDYCGCRPKENLTFKGGPILTSAWCLTFCSCLHTELVKSLFCMFSLKHKWHQKGEEGFAGWMCSREERVNATIFFPPHLMLISVNKFCCYWDISSTKLLFKKKIKIETSITFFLSARKQMMASKAPSETKTGSNHPNSLYTILTWDVQFLNILTDYWRALQN